MDDESPARKSAMLGGLEFAFWALVIVLAGIVAAALVAWFAWSNVRGYG